MSSPALEVYSFRKAPAEYTSAFLDKEHQTIMRAISSVQFPQARTLTVLGSDDPVVMFHPIVTLNPPSNVTVTVEGAAFELYTAATNAKNFLEIEGGVFYAEHDGTGTATNVVGAFIGATQGGAGTTTNLIGLEVSASKVAGSVGTATGLLVDDVTGGATNYCADLGLGIARFRGGQIQFPATQIPSSNANTLDDYEEGTWTPVIGGAGGTSGQSYSLQSGFYTKIGRVVMARFDVLLSTKGTITGNVQIQGLPFSSAGSVYSSQNIAVWEGFNTAIIVMPSLLASGTAMTLYKITAATTTADGVAIVTGDLTNTSRIIGMVFYEV